MELSSNPLISSFFSIFTFLSILFLFFPAFFIKFSLLFHSPSTFFLSLQNFIFFPSSFLSLLSFFPLNHPHLPPFTHNPASFLHPFISSFSLSLLPFFSIFLSFFPLHHPSFFRFFSILTNSIYLHLLPHPPIFRLIPPPLPPYPITHHSPSTPSPILSDHRPPGDDPPVPSAGSPGSTTPHQGLQGCL